MFYKPCLLQLASGGVRGARPKGDPFRPNLNIQPINKINGGPWRPANHDWKPFNLIWAHSKWMEHDFLEIWDFRKMSGSHFSNSRKTIGFENAHPFKGPGPIFQSAAKRWVWKSQIWEQLSDFKSPLSATLMIFLHKWEDGSRKVNVNAVNFSPTPWNVCPVTSQAIRKPCFSTSIPREQNPRFLDFTIPRFPDSQISIWHPWGNWSWVTGEPPSRTALTGILSGL